MTAIRKIGAARLGPRDWERAAVAALIEGGIEAVTIPRLAAALGVTKGSFYWHFKGLDALLTAALERWEHAYTDFGMEAFTLVADPRDRLRPWFTEAGADHEAQRLHLAVARAAHHPVIRPIFARVTEKRIDYIARSLAALKIPRAEARRRAAILHTFYMGVLMMADAAPEALGDRTVRSALSGTSFDLLTAV
jgi:AcrR family transcriptional regulator